MPKQDLLNIILFLTDRYEWLLVENKNTINNRNVKELKTFMVFPSTNPKSRFFNTDAAPL